MIDIKMLINNIKSHAIAYIIILPIIMFLFILYLNNKTVQFQSSAILKESSSQNSGFPSMAGLGQLASIAGIQSNSSDNRYSTIEIIRSRAFFKELILNKDIAQGLSIDDIKDINDKDFELAYQNFINSKFDIYFNTQKLFYEVSYIDENPSIASKNLTYIINSFNERSKKVALHEASESFNFLYNEINKTDSIELKNKISEIAKSYMEELVMVRSKKNFPLQILVEPNKPVFPIGNKLYMIIMLFLILVIMILIFEIFVTFLKTNRKQIS